MKYLKRICSAFMFVPLLAYPIYSQVIMDGYKDIDIEHMRLIIAPLLSVDPVNATFKKEYPEIKNPTDSLSNLIEGELALRMRKYSKFYSIYQSTYKEKPGLVKRVLFLSEKDSFLIALPCDSVIVRMNLKGVKQNEPDFILFIKIGSLIYFGPSSHYYDFHILAQNDFNDKSIIENKEGLVFDYVTYVFWDNKKGKIAAYNKHELFIEDNEQNYYNEDEPFDQKSRYLDLIARYILTRTPFAKPNMPYFYDSLFNPFNSLNTADQYFLK